MKSGFSARNEVSTPLAENRRPLLDSPAVPNRPATGTPTPWASRLSVLSRDRRRYSRSSSPKSFYQETHPILKSSDLQHWFKNWQHLRNYKITASTFALAIGFWPRGRAKLWLEKLGTIEPFSGNIATCWSNIKERDALKSYMLVTRNSVSSPEFQVYGKNNPEDDWLAASADGSIDRYIYGLHGHGVLEIKCPYFGGDKSRTEPWKRVPLHYDRDWMEMYVWTVHGSSLFRIYRDVEYFEDSTVRFLVEAWSTSKRDLQKQREFQSTHRVKLVEPIS